MRDVPHGNTGAAVSLGTGGDRDFQDLVVLQNTEPLQLFEIDERRQAGCLAKDALLLIGIHGVPCQASVDPPLPASGAKGRLPPDDYRVSSMSHVTLLSEQVRMPRTR